MTAHRPTPACREQPTAHQAIANGRPIGIEDIRRAVTGLGQVQRPNGTSTYFRHYGDSHGERSVDDRILCRHDREHSYLREWHLTDNRVRRGT